MADDQTLMQKVRDGDPHASGVIFDRHFDSMYRFCRTLAGVDHDDAMDLAQSTLIAGLQAAQEFRGGPLRPWLKGIARNRYRSARRIERRRDALATENLERIMRTRVEAAGEQAGRIAAVRALVGELDDGPLKQVAVRFYSDEEPTIEQVAQSLNLPRGTVSARLSRLRDRVKRQLVARLMELRGR